MKEGDREGRYSFPSGHSSSAFTSMTFLAFYLMGKFHVFSNKHTTCFGLQLLTASPYGLAIFVAVSRTMDYHHHFSDIIAGALLGSGIGVYIYYMYFPSLWKETSEIPKTHKSIKVLIPIPLDDICVEPVSAPGELGSFVNS